MKGARDEMRSFYPKKIGLFGPDAKQRFDWVAEPSVHMVGFHAWSSKMFNDESPMYPWVYVREF